MSRKHFILLAAALRLLRERTLPQDTPTLEAVDECIRTVATVCAACNKGFSFDTFYSAANYKGRDNGYPQIVNA